MTTEISGTTRLSLTGEKENCKRERSFVDVTNLFSVKDKGHTRKPTTQVRVVETSEGNGRMYLHVKERDGGPRRWRYVTNGVSVFFLKKWVLNCSWGRGI